MPYTYGRSDVSPGDFGFSLAIVEEAKQLVIGRLNEFKFMELNATVPSEMKIDASGYFVGKSVPIFGIKIIIQNYMSAVAFREEIMNLYVVERGGMREILRGMSTYRAVVELFDHECDPSMRDERTKVVVKKSILSVHSDLVVDRKVEYFTNIGRKDDCKKVRKKVDSHRYVLKYDGRRFRIPKTLRALLD